LLQDDSAPPQTFNSGRPPFPVDRLTEGLFTDSEESDGDVDEENMDASDEDSGPDEGRRASDDSPDAGPNLVSTLGQGATPSGELDRGSSSISQMEEKEATVAYHPESDPTIGRSATPTRELGLGSSDISREEEGGTTGASYQSPNRPAGTKNVAIAVRYGEDEWVMELAPRMASSESQKMVEKKLLASLPGVWYPLVVNK
jgi:hypothetical protein